MLCQSFNVILNCLNIACWVFYIQCLLFFKLDFFTCVLIIWGIVFLIWLQGRIQLSKLGKELNLEIFLSGLSRCEPRFLGRCSIKQVGHYGWLTKKILSCRSSKTCLNHILCTVSLWSALYGLSVAACVMYASHNITKTNVKTEFQKCINS